MSTSGGVVTVSTFPDFTGSGSPEGVQTANVGQSYVDTTNGALYFKITGAGNTGWTAIGGTLVGTLVEGVGGVTNGQSPRLLAKGGNTAGITDIRSADPMTGLANELQWSAGGADGEQFLYLQLGPSGEFAWTWAADGSTAFPGGIAVAAVDSHTATAAFSALAVDTPLQSSLAYDVLVSGTIRISSATAGTIALGVGSGATPTTDPFLTSLTSATEVVVGYSAVVPAGYYLSFVSGGTIVVASLTAVATPL